MPDFSPMPGGPDARRGLMPGKPMSVSSRCSWAESQSYVICDMLCVWYVVDFGSSLSFVLTVFSFGLRYFS